MGWVSVQKSVVKTIGGAIFAVRGDVSHKRSFLGHTAIPFVFHAATG